MDATLGFILIFVLAVLLVALGIGLSRRAQRKALESEAPPRLEPAPRAAESPTDAGTAEPEAEPGGLAEPEVEQRETVRLRDRLGKSRAAFAKLRGRRIDDDTWEDLEDTLLLADVGVPTTERILGDVRERAKAEKTSDTDALIALLHAELVALLDDGDKTRTLTQVPHEPNVWMFVGVNGVGKTTTIGKLATRYVSAGKKVGMAAGDTFRAAAVQQLEAWGTPAFLLVPNAYHRLDIHAFKARYPGMKLVCPAPVRDRVAAVAEVDGDLSLLPVDAALRCEMLDGVKHGEAALIATHERDLGLIFGDAVFNLPHLPGLDGALFRLLGSTGGPRVTWLGQKLMVSDKAALAAQMERLAALPGLRWLLPSHGAVVEEDAAGVLRAVAARLLG